MSDKIFGNRVVVAGTMLSAACLGYVYIFDRIAPSDAESSPIFRFLLATYDLKSAWLVLAVCLLALLWRRSTPILTLADFLARRATAIIFSGVILSALGSIALYRSYPLSMDEYAAVFQSKVFAMGQLAAHLPPPLIHWLILPGFNGKFLIASSDTGHVIETYWPGFALLLAPFQALGVPWLCNALLAGIALCLIFQITTAMTGDRRAGGFALLFTIASGAFFANAISFYAMQAHLTANLLFAWLLLTPTKGRALAAGIVGSVALVLHNPVPHMLFAAPWLFAMIRQKDQRRYLPPLLLGYLPLSIAIGFGWVLLRMQIGADVPHGALTGGAVAAIFGWPDVAMLTIRAAALAKMWVWAVPGLYLFALIGRLRLGCNPHVRLLTQSAVLTFAGYLFVNLDQGHGWGYRYFHSAWGAIPILAGCAMSGRNDSDDRLVAFAGAAAILSLLLIVPLQLSQIDGFIAQHLAQLPPARRPGNNVYFIRPRGGFYLADMIQCDPGLRSQDLLLVSYGPQQDAAFIRAHWPDAVEIGAGRWGEQWYLGPIDRSFAFPAAPLTRSQ